MKKKRSYAATIILPRDYKKYYAATNYLDMDKREMRHKNDIITELNRERENDAAKVLTSEVPENLLQDPESRKINENTADIKYISYTTYRSYEHRGGSNNGTRQKIPQNKGKFPEPDKLENFRKLRENCSLANEQYNMK
jgi:hypothetical protein